MAQENMDEWRMTPIFVIETVKVVFNYMKEKQLLGDDTGIMADREPFGRRLSARKERP